MRGGSGGRAFLLKEGVGNHGSAPRRSGAGITDKSMGGRAPGTAHQQRQRDRQLRNVKDEWQVAHLDDAFGK